MCWAVSEDSLVRASGTYFICNIYSINIIECRLYILGSRLTVESRYQQENPKLSKHVTISYSKSYEDEEEGIVRE